MKLKDIFEVNFQNVDVYEPSGVSSPTMVDPDKVKEMRKRSRKKGKKKLKRI